MEKTEKLAAAEIEQAIAEAGRCLNCKTPQCQAGCPIGNDIPEFVAAIARGDMGEARRVIARKSNLPAICGRVCAHEQQCQSHCVLAKAGKEIQIGFLERFAADFAFAMKLPVAIVPPKTRGRVGVIGSGPAGLTVAGDLAKQGFAVTVFEALDEPGGVLLYGIPPFRLPKEVVRREVARIEMLGVRFTTGCAIGRDMTVDDLFAQGYDAVFIGSGTAQPRELDIPGKQLQGVIQSGYLLRMNYLLHSGQIPRAEVPVANGEAVLVIGAGNVAMDAARTAVRLGAGSVTVLYRKDESKITALQSEYRAAAAEGVRFGWNTTPMQYTGRNGVVQGLVCEGSAGSCEIACDKVFLAVGSRPASRIVSSTLGIEVDEQGYVQSREKPYGMTTRKGVFAGGDVVHRPATVVIAMKEAKKVAAGIAEYVDAVKLLAL